MGVQVKRVLIVAVSENGVIGHENRLPWFLPGDLKFFRKKTMGKPVIMGRKTFESLGKPLKGRENIVLTRNQKFKPEGIHAVGSLDEAFEISSKFSEKMQEEEIYVIGGEEIFKLALDQIDKIYLTEIQKFYKGDAFFHFDKSEWNLEKEIVGQEEDPQKPDYTISTFKRKNSSHVSSKSNHLEHREFLHSKALSSKIA